MQESLLTVTGNCRKPLAREKQEVEDLMLRPKDPEKSYKLWENLEMYWLIEKLTRKWGKPRKSNFIYFFLFSFRVEGIISAPHPTPRSMYFYMLLGKDVPSSTYIVFSFTVNRKNMWKRNSCVLSEIGQHWSWTPKTVWLLDCFSCQILIDRCYSQETCQEAEGLNSGTA